MKRSVNFGYNGVRSCSNIKDTSSVADKSRLEKKIPFLFEVDILKEENIAIVHFSKNITIIL